MVNKNKTDEKIQQVKLRVDNVNLTSSLFHKRLAHFHSFIIDKKCKYN